MNKLVKNKIFWISAVVFAAVIFLAVINTNKTYQAEIDILFLPKNEVVARNVSQVMENAKQLPLTLAFYNNLVENNPDIEDGALELPNAKRKSFWNEKIQTKQIGTSGILRVRISDKSALQAENISRQVVAGISMQLSRYYNIKTEMDARIIDGPIITQVTKINVILWVFLSLLFGCILGFVVNAAMDFISEKNENSIENKQIDFPQKTSIFPKIDFPQMEIKKDKIFYENKDIEFNIGKKAPAPANLPIAEENFTFKLSKEEVIASDEINAAEKIAEPIISVDKNVDDKSFVDATREATPEEVKARLNRLLSGGKL